ncbi:MAG: hypothetical protein AB1714_21645 [Acidobacteriota bacterium]
MNRRWSRRDFIAAGALGGMAGWWASSKAATLLAQSSLAFDRTKVIVARDEKCINGRNECDPVLVKRAFDRSLLALTGRQDARAAWTSLGLAAADVVAVKMNCCTWTIPLAPHKELVRALCDSLGTVIPQNNIILYDRSNEQLDEGGFAINQSKSGVRCFGNDQGGGYDEQERLTRIVTNTCTKLINLASLKCVEWHFGGSIFMKNHIGTLMSEDMPKCHGNPDFLAEVSSRPSIRKKTILQLCDGLRGSYQRGVPWYWAGIIMGRDPVASECVAMDVINEKRIAEKVPAIEMPAHLLIAAGKYRIGTCNAHLIERVRV